MILSQTLLKKFSPDLESTLLDTVFINGLEATYFTSAYAVLYVGRTEFNAFDVAIFTGMFNVILPTISLLLILAMPCPINITVLMFCFNPFAVISLFTNYSYEELIKNLVYEKNELDKNVIVYGSFYKDRVEDMYHDGYVRPQESGTRTGLRSWKVMDKNGFGIEITSPEFFSASALNYSIEQLDFTSDKYVRHTSELEPADATYVNFDKLQLGLGCINSWGDIALPPYRVPFGEYNFEFVITIL